MNIFLPQHLIAKTNRTAPGPAAIGERPNTGRTKASHLAPAKRMGGVGPISTNMTRNPQRKTSTKTIYYIITSYFSIITITCIHLKILMSYYGSCSIYMVIRNLPSAQPLDIKDVFSAFVQHNEIALLFMMSRSDHQNEPAMAKTQQARHTGFGKPSLRR